ncbi:MAG: NUDIX domain-containing protein [Desulfosalsimonadaceae bacterium]
MHPVLSIAYFVTSHGFGHAARASAVMNAIYGRWPFVHFDIFTGTPEWFFQKSVKAPYAYHWEQTDVGLVQTSPLHVDLEKTIAALDAFLPFDQKHLDRLASKLCAAKCHLVISDISPLGIAAATYAGVASALVENFTWDWIYDAYVPQDSRFQKHIDMLRGYFGQAACRVQASPVCGDTQKALPHTPPISRMPETDPRCTRKRLGIAGEEKMVLITMGGISGNVPFVRHLAAVGEDICFVVPVASVTVPKEGKRQGNVIFLPHNSAFYHPDLVHAADGVVGKIGYSTLAEVYHAGVPYGFVSRPDFRESPVLESYVAENLSAIKFTEGEFYSGAWLKRLSRLLDLPRPAEKAINGADAAAGYICDYLSCEKEILEVVDTCGCIVGAAPRKSVHGDNRLLHRVVHVLVCDRENRLLLQKRSLKKQVAPGRWDTSVGGHVDCGESIEAAMYREMAEELGIRPQSPQFAYQYIHANDFESELVFTYTCQYDGDIAFNPEEIDAVKFWDVKEIENHLGKGVLSDNFEDEFKRYLQWLKADSCGR